MTTEAEEMYAEARKNWTNGPKNFDWTFPTVEGFALHFGFDNRQPGEKMTPREEFQLKFGPITDDQWQWLKEFVARNTTTVEKVTLEDIL